MNPPQPSKFSLDGNFLGFIRVGSKFKYLRLAIAKEEFQIKLSKEARASCQAVLHVNDWIQVMGEMQVNPETGDLKLKADQIRKLDRLQDSSQDSSLVETALFTHALPLNPIRSEILPNRPKLKLLVCQKSSCQKKGGRKQRQAIESALCDRNLLNHVVIQETGCLGKCSMAPNLVLMPGKKRVSGMNPQAIANLLSTYFP